MNASVVQLSQNHIKPSTTGMLEHINYYHYQLMHDTVRDLAYLWQHRRLRRSPLTRDLAAVKARQHKCA